MSPPVPLGDEPDQPSHLRPASQHELRLMKEATQKSYTLKDVWWFLGALAAVVVATAWAQDKVQAKVDAGVAPLRDEVSAVKRDVRQGLLEVREEARAADRRAEVERERNDKRWEAVLWRLKVPDPAPARDGGQ